MTPPPAPTAVVTSAAAARPVAGPSSSFHDASMRPLTLATEGVSSFDNPNTAPPLPEPSTGEPDADPSCTSFHSEQHPSLSDASSLDLPVLTEGPDPGADRFPAAPPDPMQETRCAAGRPITRLPPWCALASAVRVGRPTGALDRSQAPKDPPLPSSRTEVPELLASPGPRGASTCASLRSVGHPAQNVSSTASRPLRRFSEP